MRRKNITAEQLILNIDGDIMYILNVKKTVITVLVYREEKMAACAVTGIVLIPYT